MDSQGAGRRHAAAPQAAAVKACRRARAARRASGLAALLAALLVGASGPAGAADNELDSIVVTAQSRSQAERDVPIAMQVITVRQIEDVGAANLADLNGYLPGLSVDGSQPTQPNFSLRGIGTTDFGIGTDAPVGVYMDGIYTGKTGGSLMNFNDVQRVEVLKGPQGTLFGRNSAAGAIAIVSNEPEQATDATGLLRYGRFDTIEFKGMVNLPLGDAVAARLAVASRNSQGWLTDQTTGEKFGGDGNWGSRASLRWNTPGGGKVVASWEHEALDQPARAVYSLVAVAPGAPAPPFPPNPANVGSFVDPLHAPLQNDAPNRETRTLDGLTVRYERDLAGLQFSSSTAYRHFRTYNGEDNDGTSNIATYLNTINAEVNSSWQQEFKVGSKNDRLDWIAGASVYHVDAGQVTTINTTTDTVNTLTQNAQGTPLITALNSALAAQIPGFPPGFGLGNPWQEKMINASRTTSYALYGDVIWHLGKATNLTTGLRATRDHKDVNWYTPPYSAPALDAAYAGATGLTFSQLTAQALGAPITNIAFANAALLAGTPVGAARSWSDLSPRLVLDHKYDVNTMVYASVARGFQSGGYDVFNPLAGFEPEHMTNLELGLKAALPALHASVEASLFHYRFTNLQNITLITQPGSLPTYDVTTSDQHAIGADLSGTVAVGGGATLFGAAEYLRQAYGTYSVQDGTVRDHLDGQPVGTPLLNLALGGRLAWAVASGKAEFLLQGTHATATRCNAHLTFSFECLRGGAVQTGTATTRVDLRLGWAAPENRYGIALLVNNALNKQYFSVPDGGGESAYTLGTPYGSIGPAPRTYLLELSASL